MRSIFGRRDDGRQEIHNYVHNVPDAQTVRWQKEVLGAIKYLVQEIDKMAKTLDELLAQVDTVRAKVEANTDLEKSIIQTMQGQAQSIKDLKAMLDAAGQDPAKLAALGDAMDALSTKVEAEGQQAADAITAGTPVA